MTQNYYAPPLIGGGIKRCFCLTSVWRLTPVCLSVAYIGPKSRTERPRKTKIGTEVPHVTRDSDTTFKVKRSKVNLQGAGAYSGDLPHSLLYFHSSTAIFRLLLFTKLQYLATVSWDLVSPNSLLCFLLRSLRLSAGATLHGLINCKKKPSLCVYRALKYILILCTTECSSNRVTFTSELFGERRLNICRNWNLSSRVAPATRLRSSCAQSKLSSKTGSITLLFFSLTFTN